MTAVSIGDAESDEVLRRAIAMGAKDGFLIETGDVLHDPGARATLIQNFLKKESVPFDAIFTGVQSEDDQFGAVGGILAAKLGLPFVSQACKPLPFGCRRAMRLLGFRSRHTGVVGDQLFADVMAARMAGLASILVRPIHPEEEPWFTRMKRPLERVLLRHMHPPIEDFGRVCSNRCLLRKP